MATGDLHTNFRKDRSSGSKDMLSDRQTDTQTDTQADCNTLLLMGCSNSKLIHTHYYLAQCLQLLTYGKMYVLDQNKAISRDLHPGKDLLTIMQIIQKENGNAQMRLVNWTVNILRKNMKLHVTQLLCSGFASFCHRVEKTSFSTEKNHADKNWLYRQKLDFPTVGKKSAIQ